MTPPRHLTNGRTEGTSNNETIVRGASSTDRAGAPARRGETRFVPLVGALDSVGVGLELRHRRLHVERKVAVAIS
jgi:hypothetical protein